MFFKIDTKQKFTVITPNDKNFSDKLTAPFAETALNCLASDIKNIILNMEHVQEINKEAAQKVAELQQQFYESNASFVICSLQPAVENMLEDFEMLELLNVTPTESEAWDIVQMEEIERELMDDDNPSFNERNNE